MKKTVGILTAFSCGMLLSACSTNPEETIYEHYEAAVEEEAIFAEQQSQLQEAEQQEQNWYDEIIQLGMDDFETIVSLSNEARGSIEQRRELLDNERSGIDAGYEEASKAESEYGNLESGEAQELANQVQEAMDERYESYSAIYDYYSESLELDDELFALLAQEDLDIEELEQQIELVNEKYTQITEATEEFNSKTDTYNELKRSFYESAGLSTDHDES